MSDIKSLVKQFAILSIAGQASIAQGNPQGTIDRQRPVLTSYSTSGWLSDHTDPRFWFWNIPNLEDNGAYSPSDHRYPGARRWVHFDLNQSLDYFDPEDGDSYIEGAAADIVSEIENRIFSGDLASIDPNPDIDSETFALFIKDIGYPGDLISHEADRLKDIPHEPKTPGVGTPIGEDLLYPWPKNSQYKGTPWRSEGVMNHRIFFEALVEEIQSQIEDYNQFLNDEDKIPLPSRYFVDQELDWGLGSGQAVIGVYNSTMRDGDRYMSKELIGDFSNWTSEDHPTAFDIMGGFNPAYATTEFSWYSYDPEPNSLLDQNQLRDMTIHRSMLSAVMDGALEASMAGALHTTWGGLKWSNYGSSGWYTDEYPMFLRSNTGAVGNTQLYGWSYRTWNGSADMQSPVLYPPFPQHTLEFENPSYSYPTNLSTDDQIMEAGVRLSRLYLDHAIFSFDDLTQAPRHITPWVPQFDSPVNGSNQPSLVSKKYTRDIVALCKAKGVNEIIFWGGDTDTHEEARRRWAGTNDVLSQVWDYNLKRVVVWPGNTALSASDLTKMTFSEEHTFDLDVLDTTSTDVTAQIEVEFDVSESLEAGTEYTLILEAMDGGGPWADADYTVKIRNFQTGQYGAYEPVNAVYEEMNDISTRRVVFTDDPGDTDTLYDEWSYEFDDQSVSIPNVEDRKSIHKWVITLPYGSLDDYLYEHSTQGWKKMKFQIIATHESPPSVGDPDPLRIDLLQLYESEQAHDNVQHDTPVQPSGGDLNQDGTTDILDLMHFIRVYSDDKTDPSLDMNQDGQVDANDLAELGTKLAKGDYE
ncbi:MAG: dockerin type I domain-containing protein [Phycisphaerales bacterium]